MQDAVWVVDPGQLGPPSDWCQGLAATGSRAATGRPLDQHIAGNTIGSTRTAAADGRGQRDARLPAVRREDPARIDGRPRLHGGRRARPRQRAALVGRARHARHPVLRPDRADRRSGPRAVRRAITPLFRAGAITTTRHASGRAGRVTTVRYRLWLDQPAPDGIRRKRRSKNGAEPVDNPGGGHQPAPDGIRPKRRSSIGRNVAEHRTKSGRAQDGIRPPKEKEEKEERDITGVLDLDSSLESSNANGAEPVDNPGGGQVKIFDYFINPAGGTPCD